MFSLEDLLKKARGIAQGAGKAILNATPPAGFFKTTVPQIQQGLQNFGQTRPTASRIITNTLQEPTRRLDKFLEEPYKPVVLPELKLNRKTNLSKIDEMARKSTPNPFANKATEFVVNKVAKPYAEGILNFPRNYVSGIYKTGKNIGDITQGKNVSLKELLGNTGTIGKSVLDVGVLPAGKNLALGAADVAMNMGLKNVAKIGAKEGFKFGAEYGLFTGFEDNKDQKNLIDYIKNIAGSTLTGGAGGAILGGGLAAGGHTAGKVWGTINNTLKKIFPTKSSGEIANIGKQYLRDEVGRFATGPKKNEPVFYGDLRESLGMPRSGADNPIGLQAKPKGGNEAILEAGKVFDFSQKLGKNEYKIFNDAFKKVQSIVDVDKDLREELSQNLTGSEAYSKINSVISIGQEPIDLIDEITNGLKNLGYARSVKEKVAQQINNLRNDRKQLKQKNLDEVFNQQKTFSEAPDEYLNDIRNALYTDDETTARQIYDSLAKEYKMPDFEVLRSEATGAQNEALSKAKTNLSDIFGEYTTIANKMKGFLAISGEKKSKKTGELFREHIPRDVFGVSSDEIANDLGMSEGEFMGQLIKDIKIVSSGKATPTQVNSFKQKIAKLKSLYDKLDPDFYKVLKDWDNKVSAVSAQATPQTMQKIKKEDFRLQEKMAKDEFGNWQRALFEQAEAKSPKEAIKTITSSIQNKTLSPLSRSVEQLKDISGFVGGARDLYRNFKAVFGKKYEDAKRIILDPFDNSKKEFIITQERWLKDLDKNVVKDLGIRKGSRESEFVQLYGEKLITLDQLKKFAPQKWEKIVAADQWFRKAYDTLLNEVNQVRARIYPTNPSKIIPRRDDYYRHFRELAQGYQGLLNIFENPAGISSSLSGISEFTKPKSKFLSFAQRRLGIATDIDAVGGFLNYLRAASYAKNIDPHIEHFRNLANELALQTESSFNKGKLNNFIEYLNDFANDLSGKTNPFIDRSIQKYIPGGRKTFRVLDWVNSRVKANIILGNLSSSIAQIFNVPQGIASAGIPNSLRGMSKTLSSIFTGKKEYQQSGFIKERYFKGYDKFDTGILNDAKKFATWVTQVLDEVGTKFIWNSHFEKALAEKIGNPIKYADYMTRSLVAGRGIGEVPIMQKSKVTQLLAPFQLEVGNLWWVMKDFVDQKEFGKLATLFVGNYLFNRVAESIRGSDVTFDPINATIEGLLAYDEEKDKKTGLLRAGGRVAGEVLSNVPGGQSVATLYPEFGVTIGDYQSPTRKELFGRGDPTRFGSGLISVEGFKDPFFKLIPPFGGQQIKRTIEGLKTVSQGYGETAKGDVQTSVDQSAQNYVRGGLFGKSSLPEYQKYYKNSERPLSETQSDFIKSSNDKKGVYNSIMSRRDLEAKENEVKEELKTQGGSSLVGDKIFYNDNGEIKSVNLGEVTSMPSATSFDKAKKRDKAFKLLDNIADLPDEQKLEALGKLDISVEDASYYTTATQAEPLRYIALREIIDKQDNSVKAVIPFIRSINGEAVATSGIFDRMYEDGLINKDQKAFLKALKWDEEKQDFRLKRDYKSSGEIASKKKRQALLKYYNDSFNSLQKILTPSQKPIGGSNISRVNQVLNTGRSTDNGILKIEQLLRNSTKKINDLKPYTVR